jgi:hypothetical protein
MLSPKQTMARRVSVAAGGGAGAAAGGDDFAVGSCGLPQPNNSANVAIKTILRI